MHINMYKYAILSAQTICTSVTTRATGGFFACLFAYLQSE